MFRHKNAAMHHPLKYPKTADIMSRAHLNFPLMWVEMRRLLGDVTGWVVTGELAAPTGEPGAGEVCSCVCVTSLLFVHSAGGF